QREQGGGQARPRSVHHPAEQVAAEFVGAEQVGGGGRQQAGGDVLGERVGGGDEPRGQGGQADQGEDGGRGPGDRGPPAGACGGARGRGHGCLPPCRRRSLGWRTG